MQQPEFCHEFVLCETIESLLTSQPQWRCFGLLDGIEPSPLLEQFLLLHPEADYQPLFLGTDYEPCLPASPYLVEINPVDSDFMRNWGSQASLGAIWFVSPFALGDQWQYWRSLLLASTEHNDNVLFRFWIGGIFRSCLNACTDVERSQLLAPSSCLFAPDEKRQWQIFRNPIPPVALNPPPMPWWHLREEHLQPFATSFDRILTDEIEDVLWRSLPDTLAGHYPAIIPLLINQGIQQARQLGLTGDQAITRFVQCQFYFTPDFWRAPQLDEIWHQPNEGDIAFLDWCRTIAPPFQLD